MMIGRGLARCGGLMALSILDSGSKECRMDLEGSLCLMGLVKKDSFSRMCTEDL